MDSEKAQYEIEAGSPKEEYGGEHEMRKGSIVMNEAEALYGDVQTAERRQEQSSMHHS